MTYLIYFILLLLFATCGYSDQKTNVKIHDILCFVLEVIQRITLHWYRFKTLI